MTSRSPAGVPPYPGGPSRPLGVESGSTGPVGADVVRRLGGDEEDALFVFGQQSCDLGFLPDPVGRAVRKGDPVAPVVSIGVDDPVPALLELLKRSRFPCAGHARDEDLLHSHKTTKIRRRSVARASCLRSFPGSGTASLRRCLTLLGYEMQSNPLQRLKRRTPASRRSVATSCQTPRPCDDDEDDRRLGSRI
jgi:hypothetical protein